MITKVFRKIHAAMMDKAEEERYLYRTFGIFGIIAYPLYYILWIYVDPQGYENFSIRLGAVLLCIPLVFKKYWPEQMNRFLPFYWYITLLYCLPIFFTFMLLKNELNFGWSLNALTGIVLAILLLDTLSLLIIFPLGIFIGWLGYILTTIDPIHILDAHYRSIIITYAAVILFGAIFSYKKTQIKNEKLKTMEALGASIAHELRTPLRAIESAAVGIKENLPMLIESHEIAQKNNLEIPFVSPRSVELLATACDEIEIETTASFTFINMLLMNAKRHSVSVESFGLCSINECVDEALRRYPFSMNERQLIHWEKRGDFKFQGDQLLVIHVLFNLLKNAIYYVRDANKGEISIWVEIQAANNILHFKDTGKGVAANILPHIFDRFFSRTRHGTGVGLAFCKMVMEAMGGGITCRSEYGQYTEFLLYFPK